MLDADAMRGRSMTTDEPVMLGRYELVELLARGGMGELWRGRLPGAAGWEKDVAVKTILPHLVDDEAFVNRFVDEARIAVTLSHGNIVPVFDMGEDDGRYFIAMEYVRGADLRRLLRTLRGNGERVPDAFALYIAAEIARGLDYAHSREDDAGEPLHIVHRDVSPSNILISREGDVKLADFGIASARSRLTRTMTGELKGKLAYMSPEQASGQSVDPRSDLYALGAVLFEMLAGRRAFDGASDMELLAQVQHGDRPGLGALRPDLDDDIVAVVERALAMDPDERYPTAEALQVELQRLLYRETGPITQRQLSEWARRVVPLSQPPSAAPMGLDTLLNQQLDGGSGPRRASTPRSAPRSRPGSIPSAPSESRPRSHPGAGGPGPAAAHTVTRAAPRRRKARRGPAIALATVFAVIAALFWYAVRPEPPLVTITSTPDNSTVYLDGVEVGITTLRLEVEQGSHEIHVARDGFTPIEWTVDLIAGDVSTLHADLVPMPVLVTLDSVPDGATVSVSGGRPFVSGNAAPMHVGVPIEVSMVLEGYEPLSELVVIQEGQSRWVGRLEPVRVDDRELDAGGAADVDADDPVEARPGDSATSPSIDAVAATPRAEADAGAPRPVDDAEVQPPAQDVVTGRLALNFPRPPMVGDVMVDGEPFGRYDPFAQELELPAGDHRVVVTNDGAGTRFATTVSVPAGGAASVVVEWSSASPD